MTDLLPPAPKFNISKWLVSMIITASIVGGAISGVGVMLLGDQFFKIGRDPVVQEEKTDSDAHDAEFDKRLRALENNAKDNAQTNQIPAAAPAQAAVPADIGVTKIMVGLTQLKTAYDTDAPLTQGINTLKQTINNAAIQEDLTALGELASRRLPSKDDIVRQISALQQALNQPATPENPSSLGWKERAKNMLGRFVTVTKTEDLAHKSSLNDLYDKLEQAVSFDNLPLAAQLAAKLPQEAQAQAIAVQIQARLKTQQLVQKTVAAIGSALGQPEGSLY